LTNVVIVKHGPTHIHQKGIGCIKMATPINEIATQELKILKTYSVSLACKLVGVSSRQLYYWESLGIIKPVYQEFGAYAYRRYSDQDIRNLVKIKGLMDQGYTLRAAAQRVTGKHFNGRNGGTHV
jgi:hypothetical protein